MYCLHVKYLQEDITKDQKLYFVNTVVEFHVTTWNEDTV